MRLTPAAPEDVTPFRDLLEEAARWLTSRGISQWQPGSFAAQLERLRGAQAAGELLVARERADLVGGLVLTCTPDPIWHDLPRERAAYAGKLVVARSRAGSGLGAAILADGERHARSLGYEWLRLDCVASNLPLIHWYQSAGYYPRGSASSAGVDLLRHEKRIAPLTPRPGMHYRSLEEVSFDAWLPDERATLMFVRDGDRVLLIHKKRGHGAGKINGPGGKLEPGEVPLDAAVRETWEEVRVKPLAAELAAELRFQDTHGHRLLGYVFRAAAHEGEPAATEEADPFWCPSHELPLDAMWDDDRLWLPRVLEGERLIGEFLVSDEQLMAHRLRPMP